MKSKTIFKLNILLLTLSLCLAIFGLVSIIFRQIDIITEDQNYWIILYTLIYPVLVFPFARFVWLSKKVMINGDVEKMYLIKLVSTSRRIWISIVVSSLVFFIDSLNYLLSNINIFYVYITLVIIYFISALAISSFSMKQTDSYLQEKGVIKDDFGRKKNIDRQKVSLPHPGLAITEQRSIILILLSALYMVTSGITLYLSFMILAITEGREMYYIGISISLLIWLIFPIHLSLTLFKTLRYDSGLYYVKVKFIQLLLFVFLLFLLGSLSEDGAGEFKVGNAILVTQKIASVLACVSSVVMIIINWDYIQKNKNILRYDT